MSNLTRKTNDGLSRRNKRQQLRLGVLAVFFGIHPAKKHKQASPLRREGSRQRGYQWFQQQGLGKWHQL